MIHTRDPRRGELIVACCEQATSCGVREGISLAEATALARRGGPFEQVVYDPEADLQALVELAEVCERFSPIVGWKTVGGERKQDPHQPPPDTLFLDITGIGPLFGDETGLARAVLAELNSRGYRPILGAAETIGAAWAMTFAAQKQQQPQTEPIHIIPTGELESHLAELSIQTLRLPADSIDTLEQLGVFRIEQLLALPRASLASRLGERVITRLDQLLGAAGESIVAHRPPPKFQADESLEYPRADAETIEWIVTRLVEQIAAALRQRGEGVLELGGRFDCAGSPPIVVRIGLFRPTASHKHLMDLMRMQLETLRLPGPVGRIGLTATTTAPLEQRQGELFPDEIREGARELAVLIDRLGCRLGTDRVVRPQLHADPLPERAYRLAPLANGKATRSRRRPNTGPEPPSSPEHRPLEFFHPPKPLEAIAVAPEGPPISFRWAGETQRVLRHWGPERIETGWWRTRLLRRDYWRVETQTGGRFWLFRDLRNGDWLLAGVFA